MRKITLPALILIALLALGGSMVAAFAQAPGRPLASAHLAAAHVFSRAHKLSTGSTGQVSMQRRDAQAGQGTGLAAKVLHFPTARLFLHIHKFSATSNAGGLTPAQLRKAYGLSALTTTGSGVTIAVVDAFGNPDAQADLNQFDANFGLPATTLSIAYPQGKPKKTNQSWALETDLDIEMVHAMAPGARIVVDVARDTALNDLLAAVKDAYATQKASVVSMSFGGSEFAAETGPSVDGIFSTGASMGVSFTVASGDSGMGAQYPAASPFVTAVGGTTLTTQPDGTYVKETAWHGSGGGISAFEKRPTYQSAFNHNAKRGLPDVAMVADPNTGVVMYDGFGYNHQKGFFVLGGTSVAAPLFAGVLALANQMRASSMKNANVDLYSVASLHYASDFHDIVSGSNGTCGAVCNAGPGYDYVTGLGSPVANTLVPALTAAP
jgi:subtilase family serine protease